MHVAFRGIWGKIFGSAKKLKFTKSERTLRSKKFQQGGGSKTLDGAAKTSLGRKIRFIPVPRTFHGSRGQWRVQLRQDRDKLRR